MAITNSPDAREFQRFTESTSQAGEVAVKVVNPDGTDISAGGGGGDVNVVELGGNSISTDQGASDTGTQRTVTASDSPDVISLEVIDDWDESDRAKVNPVVGQAGVAAGTGVDTANTQRISLATDVPLPSGTNTIGEVTIDNSSLNGPSAPTVDSYTSVTFNFTNGNNQSLVSAPGANKQIWIYGYHFSVGGGGNASIELQDEDDTTITEALEFSANGGATVQPSGNFSMPALKVATNKALEADIDSAITNVSGWIAYGIIDVS